MLRALHSLHGASILHADVKPDNVAIRLAEPTSLDSSAPLGGASSGAWAAHGVALLDFGRAIDTSLYPEGTTFRSSLMADTFECAEMREGREWTTHPDASAIAACAHFMLHGEYMELVRARALSA